MNQRDERNEEEEKEEWEAGRAAHPPSPPGNTSSLTPFPSPLLHPFAGIDTEAWISDTCT
jgi:hypothetical protein